MLNSSLIGLLIFVVFLLAVILISTRRISTILALPLLALVIALIAGVPGPVILGAVYGIMVGAFHVGYLWNSVGQG